MTEWNDDRPPETVGEEQKRRLRMRKEEPSDFETMADKLRKSGLRPNADGSYTTNEGTVVLEAPTEAGRREIYAESAKTRRSYFGYKGRDPTTEAFAKMFAGDPELDIDWGDYAPAPAEKPMLTGICEGGPYARLSISHPEPLMLVAIDTTSSRPLVGQVGPSQKNPYIRWFAYIWTDGKWVWDDSPRQPSETANAPK